MRRRPWRHHVLEFDTHNIEPLEQDLDTTVITWMNVTIWASMKRGNVTGPINGFGKLLASL
jgi:maleate cis-trans isomerase